MATINREYGAVQNEALLRNILRRSRSMPAHFTSISIIRGRDRITAGANLAIPFGVDAPGRFDFNPNLSVDQGPMFKVSPQSYKEFYSGYVTPISATAINYYLQQDLPRKLLLSLFISRIRIRDQNGTTTTLAVNSPRQPSKYKACQRMLQRLIDQGLTMEVVTLVNQLGPSFSSKQPLSLDQLLSAHKQGLSIQQKNTGRYQLVKESKTARFCFRKPHEPLFKQARCSTGLNQQFAINDPKLFSSTGSGRIVFSPRGAGSIEIYTRSLAEVLDYLGDIVRAQQVSNKPLMVRTATGQQPILVVLPTLQVDRAAVTTEFSGTSYSIPAEPAGGQSGSVLTIISQLLAQVQSVEDLPFSNAVTIIGD